MREACEASLQPPGHGPYRPLLPAQDGPGRAHRGDRGCHGPVWWRRARCAISGCARSRRTSCAARQRYTPIAALQYEYSLWTREVEGDVLDACRDLGIGLVAYSPMGRGFLTGKIKSRSDLSPDDWRSGESALFRRATWPGTSNWSRLWRPWLGDKGLHPGPAGPGLAARTGGKTWSPSPAPAGSNGWMKTRPRLIVRLSAEELQRIDAALPPGAASGERY